MGVRHRGQVFFFLPLPIPQYSSYKSNVHRLSSHDYAYSIPENKLDTRIGIVLHTLNFSLNQLQPPKKQWVLTYLENSFKNKKKTVWVTC